MGLKAFFDSEGGRRWCRVAWVLCAAYVVFQTVQQYYGAGLKVRLPMEVRKMSKDGDMYEWRLQHRYRNPLMVHRAVLLEDGWPLQRAERVTQVMERKNGWFNIYRDLARWVPVDGSDPRTNGRKYEMEVPRQYEGRELWLPWVLLVALSLTLKGGKDRAPGGLSPRAALGLVAVTSLVVAAWRVWAAGLFSDGVFSVGGQPESDASAWYQHAQGLAEGWGITTGFSGQRPFYSVLMVPLFLLPGDPMMWIRGLHIVLWAMAAVGVYALGVTLRGPLLGVCCAAALLLGETHLTHVLAVLTENPGLSLSILATLALWLGLSRGRVLLLGVSGLLMGFANLAAGATLLSLPGLAITVLLFGWRRERFQTGLRWSVVFTLSVSAVFLPWMIRQKMVMNTFSPSTNSATLLRGGADPVHKQMWPGMHDEPAAAGIARDDEAASYAYHMKLYRELVREDPVRYVKQVGEAWLECFSFFRISDPGLRLAGLMLLGVLGLRAVWREGHVAGLLVAMGLAFGWLQLERPVAGWVLLGSLLVMLATYRKDLRLWLLVILMLNLAGGTVLAGMSGNQTASRLWQVIDWAVFLILLGALGVVWEALSRRIRLGGRSAAAEPPPESEELPWVGGLTVGAAAVGVACSLLAVGLTLAGPGKADVETLTEAQQQELVAKVKAEHPKPEVRARTDLSAAVIRLGHRRYLQPAGYDTAHWMTHFGRRSFDRWVLSPERADRHVPPDNRSFGAAQARGNLEAFAADEVLVWISAPAPQQDRLSGTRYTSADGVAAVPWTNGKADWSRAVWLEPCDVK